MKISADSKDCHITLKLNVPSKHDPASSSYCKKYEGVLILSNPLQCCYCILKSDKLSEICFFIFRHIYLNNTQLDCRMAEVLTVSAGESHYPTVHRMFFFQTAIERTGFKLSTTTIKYELFRNYFKRTRYGLFKKGESYSAGNIKSIGKIK